MKDGEFGRLKPDADAWIHGKEPEFAAFRSFTGYQLHKAALRFVDRQQPALREFGVGPAQYAVLLALREADCPNQLSLGRDLSIDKASMVRFLDGLEAQAYVRRAVSSLDRRQKLVHLTPEGRQVCDRIEAAYQAAEAELLADLSHAERQTLLDLLKRINR